MTNSKRSLTTIMMLIAALIPLSLPLTLPAQAALPPGSYDKLRVGAEEALIIKVITVNKRPSSNREFITVFVTAQVVAVQRSKKGLKRGSTINIEYQSQRPNSTITGPLPLAVLAAGEYYPAFLNISDNQKTYSPAAYGESFRMTPES